MSLLSYANFVADFFFPLTLPDFFAHCMHLFRFEQFQHTYPLYPADTPYLFNLYSHFLLHLHWQSLRLHDISDRYVLIGRAADSNDDSFCVFVRSLDAFSPALIDRLTDNIRQHCAAPSTDRLMVAVFDSDSTFTVISVRSGLCVEADLPFSDTQRIE
jgi:hypothetical protein